MVRLVYRNYNCFIPSLILGDYDMDGTFRVLPQYQLARIRLILRVLLNYLASVDCVRNVHINNNALEHPLYGV